MRLFGQAQLKESSVFELRARELAFDWAFCRGLASVPGLFCGSCGPRLGLGEVNRGLGVNVC